MPDQGTGLNAPLRTFSYAQAWAKDGAGSLIKDAIIRWPPKTGQHGEFVERAAGAPECPPLMQNMIVLCDEAHNLLWPDDSLRNKHPDIHRCQQRLHAAENSVVVFCTATPIVAGKTALQDARRMLSLVKGARSGYISRGGGVPPGPMKFQPKRGMWVH